MRAKKNDLYLSMSTVPFLDYRLWNIEAAKNEYVIGMEIHYCPFCGKELPNKVTDEEFAEIKKEMEVLRKEVE